MQLGKWVGLLALLFSIYLLWKICQVLLLLFQLQRRLGVFVIKGSSLIFVCPAESGIKSWLAGQ